MRTVLDEILEGRYRRLFLALMVSNAVSMLLFLIRVLGSESFRYWFLFWNLVLAWVPLLFAALLARRLRTARWLAWQNMLLSVLWLSFLPNSFYIVSDLIHVHITGEINILFDVVLFTSCIFNGYVFGFMSVYLVHKALLRRLRPHRAHLLIAGILLACSFAIYLGRYLRWNSWDVLLHPFGILFDVSDRIINPAAHPQTFLTTFSFFMLLTGMYYVIYEVARLLVGSKK